PPRPGRWTSHGGRVEWNEFRGHLPWSERPEEVVAEFVIHVGSCTAQGKRSNNEDRLYCDPKAHVFLVADGMGGQDSGERASGLAADIIPRVVSDRLAAQEDPGKAVQSAINEAHQAIIREGQQQQS